MVSRRTLWSTAPEQPHLRDDEVHVWRAYLDQKPSTLRELWPNLAIDERQRADKFHFRKDQAHYVIARGVLRDILSRYLGCPPDLIRFSYNQYGKPELSDITRSNLLSFNVTHSHGIALFAVAKSRLVGIDIEFMREEFATADIAERFFSPKEVSILRTIAREKKKLAFFNCWTRKEAYIKAHGEGLAHPLSSFTVSLVPEEPAALLHIDNDPQETLRWSLFELSPAQSYAATLAVEGYISRIRCWQWPGARKT